MAIDIASLLLYFRGSSLNVFSFFGFPFVFGVHSISMNSCEKSYLNKHTSWLLFSQLNIFYFVPYNFIIFDVTCHIAVMVLMDFLEVNNIWMSNRDNCIRFAYSCHRCNGIPLTRNIYICILVFLFGYSMAECMESHSICVCPGSKNL